jgi:hypothetical protein
MRTTTRQRGRSPRAPGRFGRTEIPPRRRTEIPPRPYSRFTRAGRQARQTEAPAAGMKTSRARFSRGRRTDERKGLLGRVGDLVPALLRRSGTQPRSRRTVYLDRLRGGGRAGRRVQPKTVAGVLGASAAGMAVVRRRRANRAPDAAATQKPADSAAPREEPADRAAPREEPADSAAPREEPPQ